MLLVEIYIFMSIYIWQRLSVKVNTLCHWLLTFSPTSDTLEKYKAALIASIQAQDELQEQINIQKLPETLHKFKECKEAETRLKGVEHKLGRWDLMVTFISLHDGLLGPLKQCFHFLYLEDTVTVLGRANVAPILAHLLIHVTRPF